MRKTAAAMICPLVNSWLRSTTQETFVLHQIHQCLKTQRGISQIGPATLIPSIIKTAAFTVRWGTGKHLVPQITNVNINITGGPIHAVCLLLKSLLSLANKKGKISSTPLSNNSESRVLFILYHITKVPLIITELNTLINGSVSKKSNRGP